MKESIKLGADEEGYFLLRNNYTFNAHFKNDNYDQAAERDYLFNSENSFASITSSNPDIIEAAAIATITVSVRRIDISGNLDAFFGDIQRDKEALFEELASSSSTLFDEYVSGETALPKFKTPDWDFRIDELHYTIRVSSELIRRNYTEPDKDFIASTVLD